MKQRKPFLPRTIATLAFALAQSLALAQDGEEVNLSTTIIGNQEQPKVLYILPWQSPGASELDSHNIASQLQMVFGHVEPQELRRELAHRKRLQARESEAEQ